MSERAREDRDIARKWARHKKRLATVAKKTERIQAILRDLVLDARDVAVDCPYAEQHLASGILAAAIRLDGEVANLLSHVDAARAE